MTSRRSSLSLVHGLSIEIPYYEETEEGADKAVHYCFVVTKDGARFEILKRYSEIRVSKWMQLQLLSMMQAGGMASGRCVDCDGALNARMGREYRVSPIRMAPNLFTVCTSSCCCLCKSTCFIIERYLTRESILHPPPFDTSFSMQTLKPAVQVFVYHSLLRPYLHLNHLLTLNDDASA